jgi:hypothetical protein
LRVKTTKYFIGSAFRLDGDGVFWGLKTQKSETTLQSGKLEYAPP